MEPRKKRVKHSVTGQGNEDGEERCEMTAKRKLQQTKRS